MLDRGIVRSLLLCIPALAAGCVNVEIPSGVHEDVEIGTLTLEGDALTDELAASPVREAPEPFIRIGLLWDADTTDAIEVAASVDGDTWSDWQPPVVNHVEVEHTSNYVGQAEFDLPAPARFYRLRDGVNPSATFLRMELLATPMSDSIESGDGPTAAHRLVGDANVHARSEWGARSAACSSSLGTATRMTIHHTETPTNDSMSPAARLRQIQSYHMDVKGWCDIGYHYLMSRDGQLWEGRPDTLLGAHAGGNNTGNIGIAVMGSHDSTPITDVQLHSIAALISGLHDQKGIALDRNKIKGHREYNPTTCPGDALLAQLDVIIDLARDPDGGPDDPPPTGGSCSLPSDGPWACGGLTGSSTNASGGYFTTSFGCWVDSGGTNHGDAGDNCIPACSLASVGCSGMSGPTCERHHNWYAADADRFGCGSKIQVTNPDNGKSAVLIVIDRGPNCSIENTVDYWVLDMSYPASEHLFGGPTSATEHADVQIVVVDPSTPVGPSDGLATCDGGTEPPPPADDVTVIGVLYRGSDTSDRIAGATITLGDGRTVTTTPTGLWQFPHVPTGDFTVTAAAAGYQTRTITRTTYAAESWASFGLSPVAPTTGTAILQGVIYHTANSANRIGFAQVALSTGQNVTADANGYYKVTGLPAGDITVTASASGYTTGSVMRTLVDGETEWGSVRLEP